MRYGYLAFAARNVGFEIVSPAHAEEIRSRIDAVLQGDQLSIVYQPIYHLSEKRITGFESLSRFNAAPARTPDIWFREAAQVGLGVSLEMKALENALRGFALLPGDVYLSLNLSPQAILKGNCEDLFESAPLDRIILEITEHASIDSYRNIMTVLAPLRDQGLRIAVDDAGAGYASFQHILNLAPDFIKLDISLTQHINADRSRRALAAALIRFAEETGSSIIAEGIETAAELKALAELGIDKAQGYFIGRPSPLPSAIELCGGTAHRTSLAHLRAIY